MKKLSCSSKTFKVENACISDEFYEAWVFNVYRWRFIEEISKYSLEYRYLKSNKLNDKNDKNYVVFKKNKWKRLKEIVNQKIYQTYTILNTRY